MGSEYVIKEDQSQGSSLPTSSMGVSLPLPVHPAPVLTCLTMGQLTVYIVIYVNTNQTTTLTPKP